MSAENREAWKLGPIGLLYKCLSVLEGVKHNSNCWCSSAPHTGACEDAEHLWQMLTSGAIENWPHIKVRAGHDWPEKQNASITISLENRK